MDPEHKFVERDNNGLIMPTKDVYVSVLDKSASCIDTGPMKFDTSGSPSYYADEVVTLWDGRLLLSQWNLEWVVIERVVLKVLVRQDRVVIAIQSNRRIGVNFARIGLPKVAFRPLFNILSRNFPGIMSGIAHTTGRY